MEQESYIKFNCEHLAKDILFPDDIDDLIELGKTLKALGHIGKIDETMGYGNISYCSSDGNIYISASTTGTFATYEKKHFCRILDFDIESNYVKSEGFLPASSETMSHIAVYQSLNDIRFVVHIHSKQLWEKYLNIEITSNKGVKYGTKEMYYEIVRLLNSNPDSNMLVMGGHRDGLMFWHKNIDSLKTTLFTYNVL